jgi:hypothetical protein
VQAKENQNQSKQHPSDESSKQSTHTENETPRNHKSKLCSFLVKCPHIMFCWSCISIYACNATNLMH